MIHSDIPRVVRADAHELSDAAADLDPFVAQVGDAQVVLLEEATHGSHECYETRAQITRRLIRECGFTDT